MMSYDDSADLVGQVLSRRFRIRRVMGVGGMAAVYEAEDLASGRPGALKLLKPRYVQSSEAVERLIREASAAGRIASPHIVETIDAGRLDTGRPFVFMELLYGESLDRTLVQRGRLPLDEALALATQAASGLAAAHAAGVLHRDIKPANLFLVQGARRFLKILDFGVSKLLTTNLATLTREGHPLGTFSYMPPEQMMGAKHVDARADVFSLGVVLYECVLGVRPFAANGLVRLTLQMTKNEYTRPTELLPELPPSFDALIARALRPDPRERHRSMQELALELVAVREHARARSNGAEAPAPVLPPLQILPVGGDATNTGYGGMQYHETIVPSSLRKD